MSLRNNEDRVLGTLERAHALGDGPLGGRIGGGVVDDEDLVRARPLRQRIADLIDAVLNGEDHDRKAPSLRRGADRET